MSSQLVVKVTTIDDIKEHANADALELAIVGGWQCVVGKGQFKPGDLVVYFPPDTIIPQAFSDGLGVTQYLSKGRIRCAKLRGEPSFGLVIKADPMFDLGADVAEVYGATKYEPPVKPLGEQQERDHALFVHYTDIENLRNFPTCFVEGETVSLTEKTHGTNCRIGIVQGEPMAGSHNYRRKLPAEVDADYHGVGTYWYPWSLAPVRKMLQELAQKREQVILYGEVFGQGIQNLTYGRKGLDFLAFDLMLDGRYMDVDDFRFTCANYGVGTMPELARIPYSLTDVASLAWGKTVVGNGAHIREGIVVKPLHERVDPKLGRLVLKYVSDAYLLGQKEDFTDA
jgi:RNA ligase (TIGR02306 family)